MHSASTSTVTTTGIRLAGSMLQGALAPGLDDVSAALASGVIFFPRRNGLTFTAGGATQGILRLGTAVQMAYAILLMSRDNFGRRNGYSLSVLTPYICDLTYLRVLRFSSVKSFQVVM